MTAAAVNAQNKKLSTPKLNVAKEGVGIEGIVVGKSTMDDVIKRFGRDYNWTTNKKYSYQMTYPKLGLSFYICQADKRKEIFVIEIKSPYRAKTSRGVVLGQSTVEDIEKTYGKLKSGLEYRGISFYYNRVGRKRIVSSIDVTENSGIRQCKENK
ncbi:MAG TPA: hypothetical protein VGB68_03900 [Pyrinomonadaceae bacterium]